MNDFSDDFVGFVNIFFIFFVYESNNLETL